MLFVFLAVFFALVLAMLLWAMYRRRSQARQNQLRKAGRTYMLTASWD